MGRTNPTVRAFLDSYEAEWRPFRRALRRRHRPAFDRLFEHARGHAAAASHLNRPDPETATLVAVLLAHERELERLRAALAEDEAGGDACRAEAEAEAADGDGPAGAR
jgi:hypothetical protein